jgi:DNA topoisomerase-2
MSKQKKIEEIYQTMDQITHILKRPGMYIGSIKEEETQTFIYSSDDAKMVLKDIKYTPALLKIIDEVISNSCDEYRRKSNMGLDKITVSVSKKGHIEISDNGGIPVVVHKDAGLYVPEFIFGQFRTSSNYDDSEERDVVGTNGLGSKISGVMSSKFVVDTADGKKSFHRSWSNNMRILNDDLVIKSSNDHYTKISFDVDFDKFECGTELSDDFIDVIEKRCIDSAAANPGLTVVFIYKDGNKNVRKTDWHFRKFEHYIELYSNYIDIDDNCTFSDNMKKVWIFPDGNINVGFVNGVLCSKGTHIKAIRNEVNKAVAEHIKTKNKLEIQPKAVDNKYSIFCVYSVANPAYSSQTKEELTTPVERFSLKDGYTYSIPNSFIKDVLKSDLINQVVDWYKQKLEVEDQKNIRKLNKQAKAKLRSEKFIDANSKKREERELWIFEGDSAKAGFRAARNPQTQAAFMLRGVILNTIGMTPTKIMANKELSDIITILGLQWGQKNDVSKLNFGKIVIATDADHDGSKIAALLLVFFNIFPELFEAGIVYRSISPIVTASKGNTVKKYFTMDEFHNDYDKLSKSGYKFKYNKGLGSLEKDEYAEMMQQPIFHKFNKDTLADMSIKSWFGKGIASERKEILKSEV